MRLVIKLGGSIFFESSNKINTHLVAAYADLMRKFQKLGHKLGVVIGGGNLAKNYITQIRQFAFPESIYDEIGIAFTRINAYTFCILLGDVAVLPVPTNWNEILPHLANNKIIVIGGMQPGQSTNAVSAILAEFLRADYLINLTNVDGVYDRHPSLPDAKLITKLNYKTFKKIVSSQDSHAGRYPLFDLVALSIAERSKLKIVFLNGLTPDNLHKFVINGEISGSIVSE